MLISLTVHWSKVNILDQTADNVFQFTQLFQNPYRQSLYFILINMLILKSSLVQAYFYKHYDGITKQIMFNHSGDRDTILLSRLGGTALPFS